MACCAVYGCSNNKKKNKELKFYGFPKDDNIAKQWVNACRRKDIINTKSARVCSTHFEKSDFFESLRHRLLGYSPRNCRNLKPEAVPTVRIPFRKDSKIASKRSIRVEKRTRRKMAKELIDKSGEDAGVYEVEESVGIDTLSQSEEAVHYGDVVTIDTSSETVEHQIERLHSSTSGTSLLTEAEQIQQRVSDKPRLPHSEVKEHECECNCLVTAANILAAKSMIKLQRDNEELKAEISELNVQLQYIKNERKKFISERLKPIFTDGQIRCLFQPVRKRICWSDEDITSAIKLRSVSPNAYRYLREKLNYPLPAVSTLRKWVRMKLEREPSQQILDLVRSKLPSLASLED